MENEREKDRTVAIRGLTVGYRILGNEPPLLLVNGFGSSIELWQDDLIAILSKHYKVIMYDHRGVGMSDIFVKGEDGKDEGFQQAPLRISEMADDAALLLGALGIPKAHVLGWSMGGLVAEELALRHPHVVARLILYSAHCSDSLHPPTLKVIEEICDGPHPPDIEDSMRFICMLFPKDWVERNSARIRRVFGPPLGNVPVEVLRSQVKAIENWEGSCERIDGIRSPTLLIHGELDILTPPGESRRMASLIPNSRLEIVPGAGHGLMFQEPVLFGNILMDFLSNSRGQFES
jgi:pimeloyl-ACP methyl ester carboxylesterase